MILFRPRTTFRKALLPVCCALLLSGCEQLGIEDPAKIAAKKEAEGRAIGSACRLSGRSLEACYDMNKKASKADIFTGWRDMDAYMRENKMDIIPPASESAAASAPKPAEDHPPAGKEEAAPAKKGGASRSSADMPVTGARTT